jgi:transcription elongation GreA/GreB family factor
MNTFKAIQNKSGIMKKVISKAVIRDTCLQKQQELVDNYGSRVSEMTADANSLEHSTSQSEDRSAGDIEILSTMATEMEFAQREMSFLKTLNPEFVNTIVEPGAVVVTKERTFFVAVSSEKVEIDGQVIYGISTNAPIYSAMQGLKKGDTFEFNDKAYKIANLY